MQTTTLSIDEIMQEYMALPGTEIAHDFDSQRPIVDIAAVDIEEHVGQVLDILAKDSKTPYIIILPDVSQHPVSSQIFGYVTSNFEHIEPRYALVIQAPIENLTRTTETDLNIAIKKTIGEKLSLKEKWHEILKGFKRGKNDRA